MLTIIKVSPNQDATKRVPTQRTVGTSFVSSFAELRLVLRAELRLGPGTLGVS
jgi:hypothetical protein